MPIFWRRTSNGCYNITHQILSKYGIPYLIKTDKRTVFEYKKKASSKVEEDTFTQYAYACKQLGIQIETSSVPEFKPRVERLFQTLQQRLPQALRLAQITTIDEANTFLKTYITQYNNKFALCINNNKSVFENQPSEEKINLTLAVLCKRVIDSGHSIKYNKHYYRIINKSGKPIYFNKGTKCIVIKALDGSLFATVDESIFALEEIPEVQAKSVNFDDVEETDPGYIIAEYIAKYAVALNGVDVIAFAGGVGERGPDERKMICEQLKWMGVELDLEANNVKAEEREISTKDSKVKVWIVPTEEELMIARDTANLVK